MEVGNFLQRYTYSYQLSNHRDPWYSSRGVENLHIGVNSQRCSFKKNIIYGCIRSLLQHSRSFLAVHGFLVAVHRLLSSCGTWAPEHGFSSCGKWA